MKLFNIIASLTFLAGVSAYVNGEKIGGTILILQAVSLCLIGIGLSYQIEHKDL